MAPVKLAEYLFTRLRQLGVESVHGVPGDFNLTMLDHVEPAGLNWVGNANELNAAYAADGYSRIKGLGAIVTTFGWESCRPSMPLLALMPSWHQSCILSASLLEQPRKRAP